ncbi:hypothetical protein FLM55_02385 [Francisella sp. Scap27]|nr:hypothetical protein FLM55_02385 [Francisella sp. Scap27]
MFIYFLIFIYKVSFLAFIVSLAKNSKSAWLALLLSTITYILTMIPIEYISIYSMRYFLDQVSIIILAIIGFLTYNKNDAVNNFKSATFIQLSMIIITCVILVSSYYYYILCIVSGISFWDDPARFGALFIKILFIIMGILAALLKLRISYIYLAISILASLVYGILCYPIFKNTAELIFTSTSLIIMQLILIVAYKKHFSSKE